MRNLLPFILLLACPVMMIFMMRGMHGGGHGISAGHDTHPSRDEAGIADGQESEARIDQLEREVAQLRAVRGQHPEHRGAQRT